MRNARAVVGGDAPGRPRRLIMSKSRSSVAGSSAALNALLRPKQSIDAGENLQIRLETVCCGSRGNSEMNMVSPRTPAQPCGVQSLSEIGQSEAQGSTVNTIGAGGGTVEIN